MKYWNFTKILGTRQKTTYSHREYNLFLNERPIEKITVMTYPLHSDVYKSIRNFSTPQYETIYLLRNKKAFNTMFFKINYDVLVTDKNGTIVDFFIDQKTGYASDKYPNGNKVYFCAVGTINNLNIKENDRLTLQWRYLKEKR